MTKLTQPNNDPNKKVGVSPSAPGAWYRAGYFLYLKLLAPKSKNEDLRRQEFILNIILCSSLIFLTFLETTVIYNSIFEAGYNGVSSLVFSAVLLIFIGVYLLSRFGYFIVASYMFIGIYFVVTTYSAFRWGSYLPSTLLNYVLLIIISSILISTRFGFVVTGFISAALAIIGYREISHGLDLVNFWKDKAYKLNDVAEFIITFFIIMTISWLSNREIEKSLRRARKSEKALAEERDNLEITVEQRTQKLKELQTERVAELHRLAESGRQAAGFFHDLMNPLTAIALSVQELKNKAPVMADSVKNSLNQALTASRRMENFIYAIRRQSASDETPTLFSLNQEIEQAVLLLQHKAKLANVKINFFPEEEISSQGKPMQFYQIISNLLSNAIESYSGIMQKYREVNIALGAAANNIIIKVSDRGKGISPDVEEKIFNHFFTTKSQKGMGLGLAITKKIVEKDFQGSIEVASSHFGTAFTITLPIMPNPLPENG
jgi:signal transduction histidine kinase